MESWTIKGKILEFDSETHSYIYDGILLPSVTQVIKCKFGDKYNGVSARVLKNASERGTYIHKAIEDYCKEGADDGSIEVHNFNFLMKAHKLDPIDNEVPIVIFRNGEPICAGRLDLVLDNGKVLALGDIKTTATLDKEYLAYQLNLYRIGYTQCYEKEIGALYGIHLKDDKRKVVKLPIKEELCQAIIEEYERSNQ